MVVRGHLDTSITYIPSHLYYILFELLKNAMRAVCETHAQAETLPELEVVIADGQDEIVVKISDQGGGVARPHVEAGSMWKYGFSTKSNACAFDLEHHGGKVHDAQQAPSAIPTVSTNATIAGFGQGLPISRLYARYFGGDIHLQSMHGYGTDLFIYMCDPSFHCLCAPLRLSTCVFRLTTCGARSNRFESDKCEDSFRRMMREIL